MLKLIFDDAELNAEPNRQIAENGTEHAGQTRNATPRSARVPGPHLHHAPLLAIREDADTPAVAPCGPCWRPSNAAAVACRTLKPQVGGMQRRTVAPCRHGTNPDLRRSRSLFFSRAHRQKMVCYWKYGKTARTLCTRHAAAHACLARFIALLMQ